MDVHSLRMKSEGLHGFQTVTMADRQWVDGRTDDPHIRETDFQQGANTAYWGKDFVTSDAGRNSHPYRQK